VITPAIKGLKPIYTENLGDRIVFLHAVLSTDERFVSPRVQMAVSTDQDNDRRSSSESVSLAKRSDVVITGFATSFRL
jgi:hypothetical protein